MSEIDRWISAEFERVAQIICDYDSYLRLEWIPPSAQHELLDKSKVFKIVDTRNNKIVMYFDSLVSPQEILTRLWSMDNGKENVLKRMDAKNAAIKAIEYSKQLDAREAAKDFSAFIIANTKSRWRHNGRIRDDEFRDLGPIRKIID